MLLILNIVHSFSLVFNSVKNSAKEIVPSKLVSNLQNIYKLIDVDA